MRGNHQVQAEGAHCPVSDTVTVAGDAPLDLERVGIVMVCGPKGTTIPEAAYALRLGRTMEAALLVLEVLRAGTASSRS